MSYIDNRIDTMPTNAMSTSTLLDISSPTTVFRLDFTRDIIILEVVRHIDRGGPSTTSNSSATYEKKRCLWVGVQVYHKDRPNMFFRGDPRVKKVLYRISVESEASHVAG